MEVSFIREKNLKKKKNGCSSPVYMNFGIFLNKKIKQIKAVQQKKKSSEITKGKTQTTKARRKEKPVLLFVLLFFSIKSLI